MEPLLTTEEIAEYLRVEVVTVRRLVTRGELPAYRIGGEFRFTPSDIEGFVKGQRVTGSEAVDTFSKFTERSRKIFTFANQEAHELDHHYIGTEHLLLGIVHEGKSIAAVALVRSGLDLKDVRERVMNIVQQTSQRSAETPKAVLKAAMQNALSMGSSPNPFSERPMTKRAKKAIELGVDEAHRLGHHYIGTEHLLLGILREGKGLAAQVLVEGCGLQFNTVRELISHILQETTIVAQPENSEQATPLPDVNEQENAN